MTLNPNDLREKLKQHNAGDKTGFRARLIEAVMSGTGWEESAIALVDDHIVALPELQKIAHSTSQALPVSERERVLVEAADDAEIYLRENGHAFIADELKTALSAYTPEQEKQA